MWFLSFEARFDLLDRWGVESFLVFDLIPQMHGGVPPCDPPEDPSPRPLPRVRGRGGRKAEAVNYRLPWPALSLLGRDFLALGPADLVFALPRVGREPGRFLAMGTPEKIWGV